MIAQNAVKYGALASLVGIFLTIVLYLLGPTGLTGGQWGWAIFALVSGILSLAVFIVIALRIRTDEGGTINFLKLFLSLIVVTVVCLVIEKLFGYILFGLIDPDFMIIAKEATLEMMYQAKDSMPENVFEDQVERIEKEFNNSLGTILRQIMWSLLRWTIISLILAAILKKKPEDVV